MSKHANGGARLSLAEVTLRPVEEENRDVIVMFSHNVATIFGETKAAIGGLNDILDIYISCAGASRTHLKA
jgi:hypothetical protein